MLTDRASPAAALRGLALPDRRRTSSTAPRGARRACLRGSATRRPAASALARSGSHRCAPRSAQPDAPSGHCAPSASGAARRSRHPPGLLPAATEVNEWAWSSPAAVRHRRPGRGAGTCNGSIRLTCATGRARLAAAQRPEADPALAASSRRRAHRPADLQSTTSVSIGGRYRSRSWPRRHAARSAPLPWPELTTCRRPCSSPARTQRRTTTALPDRRVAMLAADGRATGLCGAEA